ncbi:MAG: aconitate hydratase AcnA [Candidatus Omnitrophica bacterium]|nr:aconitate hydratase AcnA [Candidatus Omnitrophota bacterium]
MSFDKTDFIKMLIVSGKKYNFYSLVALQKSRMGKISSLPFSIRILLESALRNYDDYQVTLTDIKTLAGWKPKNELKEIAFKPGRVILQDFTGVPCVVDLAAMREQMKRMKGDVKKINPQVPCDLVIDHSLQVDSFGSKKAFADNVKLEFSRNGERYEFLKWGQNTFDNFRVIPPAIGIIHQVNLEYLATGVLIKGKTLDVGRKTASVSRLTSYPVLYPDSLVGTDSHTTMINGIGIVGWGVGGIEAESVMLGEPLSLVMPDVIGVKLTGKLREGVTATDLVLTIVEMLRKRGVVDKFVEFFGPGIKTLSLPDRATVSNMCPEYGATIGIFPIDSETISYYKLTGRTKEAKLVEAYFKAQGLYDPYKKGEPLFTDKLELDLESIEPSLAGPKRPQDRIRLIDLKKSFSEALTAPVGHKGFGLSSEEAEKSSAPREFVVASSAQGLGDKDQLTHGSVVLAAITSCTNTSNPSVLIGAGLLAKKAVARGLKVKGFVKTSLTPGSQVVDEYLKKSGLMKSLEALGFHNVGYGCATCIGNSGPLPQEVASAIEQGNLIAASVTSGNRNFEGRINPHVKANYLASPILVVAYALAGTVNIDLFSEPLGFGPKGKAVFLKDIWPSEKEINGLMKKFVTSAIFSGKYKNASKGTADWAKVKASRGDLFPWHAKSTYIQEPPYFSGMSGTLRKIEDIKGARALIMVGDSITTDHISPAGNISTKSSAGQYLSSLGVESKDFNSYGARRGNDRVMARGTFANIRLRNLLAPGTEGSWTTHFPGHEKMSIFDASLKYKTAGIPLIGLAGKEYGTGSSRDWAAKGPALLGIRAIIAESFERIHRSNLAGMGILPLQFKSGDTASLLGLKGNEIFDLMGLNEELKPRQEVMILATAPDGTMNEFWVTVRLDTPVEIDYYRNGGILQTVLRKLNSGKTG